MGRNIEHPRIIIKYPLCPVAVMHIVIDNCDTAHTALEGMCCSHCNIIKKTETHCTGTFSMVPWRAHERAGPSLAVKSMIDSSDRCSDR